MGRRARGRLGRLRRCIWCPGAASANVTLCSAGLKLHASRTTAGCWQKFAPLLRPGFRPLLIHPTKAFYSHRDDLSALNGTANLLITRRDDSRPTRRDVVSACCFVLLRAVYCSQPLVVAAAVLQVWLQTDPAAHAWLRACSLPCACACACALLVS